MRGKILVKYSFIILLQNKHLTSFTSTAVCSQFSLLFFFSFSFGFVQINNFGVPKSANSINFMIAKILCETFSLFFFC